MRRLASALLVLVPLVTALSLPAHADPLYDFTLSQNGNVLEFTMADPQPQQIVPPPAEIELYLSGSGVFDGASSVPFSWNIDPVSQRSFFIYLNGSLEFNGYSAAFVSRGADLRDPAGDNPSLYSSCIDPCYDSVFHFVPGTYAFLGEFGPVDLTITQESESAVTPEPGTLWLLGTGMLGGFACIRRRFSGNDASLRFAVGKV